MFLDEDEKTSLHYAACLASPDILRLLIDKVGQILAKENQGKNAIDYAAIGDKTKNLKLLFSRVQKNGIQKEKIQDLKNNAKHKK